MTARTGAVSVNPECDQPDDADDHDAGDRFTWTLPAKLPCHG